MEGVQDGQVVLGEAQCAGGHVRHQVIRVAGTGDRIERHERDALLTAGAQKCVLLGPRADAVLVLHADHWRDGPSLSELFGVDVGDAQVADEPGVAQVGRCAETLGDRIGSEDAQVHHVEVVTAELTQVLLGLAAQLLRGGMGEPPTRQVRDLAQMRFAVSPMWEAGTSFRLLRSGSAHPVHRPWLEQVRPRVAAAGLDRGWLAELIPPSGYVPDFLNPAPIGPAPTLAEELAGILAAPVARVRQDLDRMEHEQGRLGPRSRTLSRKTAGAGLLLIPSAFTGPGPLTRVTPPEPPQLAYPARGVGSLREPRTITGTDAIAAVLGRSRTLLLTELETPASTTELAHRTGLSPAGVSQYLTALRDAGLVSAHRAGRSVLYARTSVAEYRRLKGDAPDFKQFLLADPDWDDDIEFPRNRDLPREIDFDW